VLFRSVAAKGIAAAGPEVTATAFEQAGDILTKTLFALRGCEPEKASPDVPERTQSPSS